MTKLMEELTVERRCEKLTTVSIHSFQALSMSMPGKETSPVWNRFYDSGSMDLDEFQQHFVGKYYPYLAWNKQKLLSVIPVWFLPSCVVSQNYHQKGMQKVAYKMLENWPLRVSTFYTRRFFVRKFVFVIFLAKKAACKMLEKLTPPCLNDWTTFGRDLQFFCKTNFFLWIQLLLNICNQVEGAHWLQICNPRSNFKITQKFCLTATNKLW